MTKPEKPNAKAAKTTGFPPMGCIMPPPKPRRKPEPVVEIPDPEYQPTAKELAEDLRVDATFDEAAQAVALPVEVRHVRPDRKA